MSVKQTATAYPTKNNLYVFIVLLFLNSVCLAQRAYPPVIIDAQEHVYKTVENTDLKLWVYTPQGHKVSDKAPAIIFFFGGGWNEGSPEQFIHHCKYLAARGMVAIVADYRVKSRHNVLANSCVTDAKSAMRWVRRNATNLGIDSNRMAAGGGSAGGHLAAACATLSSFNEPKEDQSISALPDALVLFNPVLLVGPADKQTEPHKPKEVERITKKMGAAPAAISPYHNITERMAPTIIFHGTADKIVPLETMTWFTEKMHQSGNACTLVTYEGEPHGFFNFGKKSNALFIDTVYKMDAFLVSIGFLKPVPVSTTITN